MFCYALTLNQLSSATHFVHKKLQHVIFPAIWYLARHLYKSSLKNLTCFRRILQARYYERDITKPHV